MEYQIKEEKEKFILMEKEKEVGFLKFSQDKENDYVIESIYVHEEYRGSGCAKQIFNAFLEKAKKENKKIIPICSYAQKQFEKREEIKELLKN